VERFPGLYKPDPELGYTLWPSKETTYFYPIGSSHLVHLISNRDGFRNGREFDEPDVRPRVWLLGDSMVLGDGVEAPDRLTEVMERLEPGWRVDNMGMTGWGVDLMVRAFERLVTRVAPKVVVLAFYTDDFRRLVPFNAGQGFAYPKFELQAGQLITVPFPALPAWRRLRIVQAVEQSYWRLHRDRLDLHAALLARLQHDAAAVQATLEVVFVPGRADTDVDQHRRSWLREWCQGAGVPFLDLTAPILAEERRAFIKDNEHWNETGHDLAGHTIAAFLRQTALAR